MLIDQLYNAYDSTGDPVEYVELAQELVAKNELEAAVTAYDRAYGLAPSDHDIVTARQNVLDQLAIVEHGIVFRYIPAGTFLMGSEDGDPDEQPVHPVKLNAYWLSETPISWAKYCELMDFQPPPDGGPDENWEKRQPEEWINSIKELLPKRLSDRSDRWIWYWASPLRICLQYCENETTQAYDWHAHVPDLKLVSGDGKAETPGKDVFGVPPRANPKRPWGYDEKPMVSVQYDTVQALVARMAKPTVDYRLPTEAEWEKAARGGRIGAKYAWGDEPPTHDNCDFGRFEEFSIRKTKAVPPNGYGLFAMCGGVWEWTSDWYDAMHYSQSKSENPTGPEKGEEHVLRGGSWADDAPVVTVSFRMSSRHGSSPNIGFRLCRVPKR